MKNAGLATILSFFYSGLGQIYNGQIGKGILMIILQIINLLLMMVVIGFITYPIVWIWGMVDARNSANRINETQQAFADLARVNQANETLARENIALSTQKKEAITSTAQVEEKEDLAE